MEPGVLEGFVEWVAATVVMVAALGVVVYQREVRAFLVTAGRGLVPPAPPQPQPLGRPIELIARAARRLGQWFRSEPSGLSFAKFEGLRRAYDDVLAESCRALGIEDLLSDLPPGPGRDVERLRVEYLLAQAGWRLEDDIAPGPGSRVRPGGTPGRCSPVPRSHPCARTW